MTPPVVYLVDEGRTFVLTPGTMCEVPTPKAVAK